MELRDIEQQALQLRMELARADIGPGDGERVARVRADLAAIERQLEAVAMQPAANVAAPSPAPDMQQKRGLVGRTVPTYAYRAPVQPGIVSGRQYGPASGDRRQPKRDMERFVGQSVMGILAALLIFISMAVFAVLVMPALPVPIRMIMLYVASAGVTWFGFHRLSIRRNYLWMAVAGTGIGGIYVSIILSNLVWLSFMGMTGDILTYSFLLGWAFVVCMISRKMGGPFEAIGHVGIVVASLFGFGSAFGADCVPRHMMATLMVVFFAAAEACYIVAFHKRRKFNLSCVSMLLVAWGFMIFHADAVWDVYFGAEMAPGMTDVISTVGPFFTTCLLMGLVMVAAAAYNVLFPPEGTVANVVSSVCSLIMCAVFVQLFDGFDALCSIVIAGLVCVALCRNKDEGSFQVFPFLGVVLAFAAWQLSVFNCSLAILAALAVLFVAKSRQDNYTTGACFGLMFFYAATVHWSGGSGRMLMQAGMLFAACFIVMFLQSVEDDRKGVFWAVGYGFEMLSLFLIARLLGEALFQSGFIAMDAVPVRIENWGPTFVGAVALFLVNGAAGYWLRQHGGGRALEIVSGIANIFVMFLSMVLLDRFSIHVGLHMCVAVLAVASFVYNSRRLLDTKVGSWYVCVKFFVLCWAVLASFSVVDIVISICFFLLACAAIALGFSMRNRSMRLFGLVLSCLSVCKLVLVDIEYESTALKALGFLVCGLLCFGISAAYNRIGSHTDGNGPAPD